MNQHFINELDKIGLQLIKITADSMFARGTIRARITTYKNVTRIKDIEGDLRSNSFHL